MSSISESDSVSNSEIIEDIEFLPGEIKMKIKLLQPESIAEDQMAKLKAEFFRESKSFVFNR